MSWNAEEVLTELPPEIGTLLKQAIAAGDYASENAIFREALLDWSEKRQIQQDGTGELQRLWSAALPGEGPYVPAGDVLDRLERKYKAFCATTDSIG